MKFTFTPFIFSFDVLLNAWKNIQTYYVIFGSHLLYSEFSNMASWSEHVSIIEDYEGNESSMSSVSKPILT